MPPDDSIIDIELVRQQFFDDDDLLREVVTDYKEQRAAASARIRSALAAGDLVAVAEHTHQLKGSLLTLGAQQAASAASTLESAARKSDVAASAAALPPFEAALDALAPELDRLVGTLG